MIIIGLGLIATEHFWVPKVVDEIVGSELQVPAQPIATTHGSKMRTYTNSRYDFQLQIPTDWSMRTVSDSGPWLFQSTDFSNNLKEVGVPPMGNMWVSVSQGCSDKSTAGFERQGNILEEILCNNNFELELSMWNYDTDPTHVQLLKTMGESFKIITQ